MLRLPLLAFGVTIDDKAFGFPLPSLKLFFSFHLFTPKILWLFAFSFRLAIEIFLRFTKKNHLFA